MNFNVQPLHYSWTNQLQHLHSAFLALVAPICDDCIMISYDRLQLRPQFGGKNSEVNGTNYLLVMQYQTYPTQPKSWWPGDARLPFFVGSIISLAPPTATVHYVCSRIVKLKNPFVRCCIRSARLKLCRVRKLSAVVEWAFQCLQGRIAGRFNKIWCSRWPSNRHPFSSPVCWIIINSISFLLLLYAPVTGRARRLFNRATPKYQS